MGSVDFWKMTGEIFEKKITERAGLDSWLSTDGTGVIWLHMRVDPSPKYYKFNNYRIGKQVHVPPVVVEEQPSNSESDPNLSTPGSSTVADNSSNNNEDDQNLSVAEKQPKITTCIWSLKMQ